MLANKELITTIGLPVVDHIKFPGRNGLQIYHTGTAND